ncbi:MAG: polysaccharide deacetylase [Deltaproteobacteria bacterium]|nr:polysaccharide deacetylase [Deltaproteobacteria bacterium]
MKPVIKLLTAIILAVVLASVSTGAEAPSRITGYQPVFKPFYDKDKKVKIAIRAFMRDGRASYLVLDPYRFENLVEPGTPDFSNSPPKKIWESTPFIKALYRYAAPAEGLENQGITSAETRVKGVFLTADMCPSKREFDKGFFEKTAALARPGGLPVPVAVMITGRWLEGHGTEFQWLLDEEKSGRLALTWVNHSYTHPYSRFAGEDENFLLTPGVDFEKEALSTEALLLESGVVPAPFFRYPGLISSAGLQKRLRSLTLIPIGANAWLAKGEAPKDGSIILVHGNGNEPAGIKAVLSFYDWKKDDIKNGGLRLLRLRDAFEKGR